MIIYRSEPFPKPSTYIRDRNAPVSLFGGQAVEFWS